MKKLVAIATKIGELIYELCYGDADPAEVSAQGIAETGAYMSRSFLQSIMKKDP